MSDVLISDAITFGRDVLHVYSVFGARPHESASTGRLRPGATYGLVHLTAFNFALLIELLLRAPNITNNRSEICRLGTNEKSHANAHQTESLI